MNAYCVPLLLLTTLSFLSQAAERTIEELEVASDQGDAAAQFELGSRYSTGSEGDGLPVDHPKAFDLLKKSAGQGYARAMTAVGTAYYDARGVTMDDQESVRWFRKAAEAGDGPALVWMGLMFSSGRGVARDDEQAVAWFRMAAERGYIVAKAELGLRYDLGIGVPENNQEAVRWYKEAAALGFPVAQFSLALMYKNGEGNEKDPIQAYAWAAAAFANESSNSVYLNAKTELAAALSGGSIVKAEEFASKYTEEYRWKD